MTRLFREVEIVSGIPKEHVECLGVYTSSWTEVCLGLLDVPQLGFAEVDYTTEDVDKLRQRIQELEALIGTLHVSRAALVE